MMTSNRAFTITIKGEPPPSPKDAFDTVTALEAVGIQVSSSTLYRLKKGVDNLKRKDKAGRQVTIKCVQ